MKKLLTFSLLVLTFTLLTSSYVLKYSSGIAGYTASPNEQSCAGSGCHSGGASLTKGVTITSTPTFSLSSYYPDSVYTISVTVNATGFSRFGFGCEILNSSSANSGTLQTPGANVKMLTAFNGRRNAVHSSPKTTANSATFTFEWVAPSAGSGDAIFYACGNAVNGNDSTSGDLPIPHSFTVSEGVAPTPTTEVSIKKNESSIVSQVHVFPNPSQGLTTISYQLQQTKSIEIQLTELSGKKVKELSNGIQSPGDHTEIINLTNVPIGVYFVLVTAGGERVGQKLITVSK